MSFRHFFGQSCIERWLRGASSCPNCNEKAAKKDVRLCHLETPFSNYKEFNCYAICFSQVRPHYVARLAALDTGERDRALAGEHLYLYQLFFPYCIASSCYVCCTHKISPQSWRRRKLNCENYSCERRNFRFLRENGRLIYS